MYGPVLWGIMGWWDWFTVGWRRKKIGGDTESLLFLLSYPDSLINGIKSLTQNCTLLILGVVYVYLFDAPELFIRRGNEATFYEAMSQRRHVKGNLYHDFF